MKNEVDYQEEYERYAQADAREQELHQQLHQEYDGQPHEYQDGQRMTFSNVSAAGYSYHMVSSKPGDVAFVFKLLGGIFMGIGALIIAVGVIVTYFMQQNYDKCTETTTAIVTKNIINDDTYTPVFSYTVDGKEYERKSSYSTNPPKHEVGDKVELHYEPGDPTNFYVDKAINLVRAVLYGIGGFFFVFGLVFLVIGINAKRKRQAF
ncbi:MAG: DUF3592 domain-containing protein [Ruminococcus sp.]|nr:DUF3592 domain-containing protein [Ruminococcus sp.]